MMERLSWSGVLPLLVTIGVFLLLPVEVRGAMDPGGASAPVRSKLGCKIKSIIKCFNIFGASKSPVKSEPWIGEDAAKRIEDVDYDSFVGLMGRRNAAEANGESPPPRASPPLPLQLRPFHPQVLEMPQHQELVGHLLMFI